MIFFSLLSGCSDKEKIAALERVIEEQKKAIEQEKVEAAKKEVRDEIFIRKREIENATNEAKRRADETNNIRENEIRLRKVHLDSMKRLNEAEQVLKSLRGQ
jgi:hypothetical protein